MSDVAIIILWLVADFVLAAGLFAAICVGTTAIMKELQDIKDRLDRKDE